MNATHHQLHNIGAMHARRGYHLAKRGEFGSNEEYIAYETGYLENFDINHADTELRDAVISMIRYSQSKKRFG